MDLTKLSKFLSLVLRHKPEKIGLILDVNGYADVAELINKCNKNGYSLTSTILDEIVQTNSKKRFSFNIDKTKIRANQGHSIEVDLKLEKAIPPEFLYHGTSEANLNSIRKKGIQKMKRHHVHLSIDEQTAFSVGTRYGKAVVLKIKALDMYKDGYEFFISENKVWLTDLVPACYIE